MPRRNRTGRERPAPPSPPPRPFGVAPSWAAVDGVTARQVVAQKTYRCPGCQQEIRPGTPHLVIVSEDDVEGRRHWHTPCWGRELKRRR